MLLANYAILLVKWHDKFDPKNHSSIPAARLSASHMSVPPIKLHPHSGKKCIINNISTPPFPGSDSFIEVASPLSTSCGLKLSLYGPPSKAIPEMVIISHSPKLQAKAKPSSQPELSIITQIDLDTEADNLITFDDTSL